MKKRIIAIFMVIMCIFGSIAIYASSVTPRTTNTKADLTSDSTVNLVKIKDKELKEQIITQMLRCDMELTKFAEEKILK